MMERSFCFRRPRVGPTTGTPPCTRPVQPRKHTGSSSGSSSSSIMSSGTESSSNVTSRHGEKKRSRSNEDYDDSSSDSDSALSIADVTGSWYVARKL